MHLDASQFLLSESCMRDSDLLYAVIDVTRDTSIAAIESDLRSFLQLQQDTYQRSRNDMHVRLVHEKGTGSSFTYTFLEPAATARHADLFNLAHKLITTTFDAAGLHAERRRLISSMPGATDQHSIRELLRMRDGSNADGNDGDTLRPALADASQGAGNPRPQHAPEHNTMANNLCGQAHNHGADTHLASLGPREWRQVPNTATSHAMKSTPFFVSAPSLSRTRL